MAEPITPMMQLGQAPGAENVEDRQMTPPATDEPIQKVTGPTEEERGTGKGLSPKQLKKAENYVTVLMNEMHSPNTRDDIIEILKSSQDPFVTVPQAALAINDAASSKIEKSGGKVDVVTMFMGSKYLVSDLMEIGNASGAFQTKKEDFGDLYQDSLQMWIQRGLKDGSIDPIELQVETEKIMSQNQRIGGHYLAEQGGVPYKPTQQQVIQQVEQTTARRVRAGELDKRSKEAKVANDQQLRSALLQTQQGGK